MLTVTRKLKELTEDELSRYPPHIRVAIAEAARREQADSLEEENRKLAAYEPKDFLDFVCYTHPGYHPGAVHRYVTNEIEQFFEEVKGGRSPRLIVTVPPRHGKSQLASIHFPAWIFGHRPNWQLIHASYSADLSEYFSGQVRDLMLTREYQECFPGIRPDANTRSKSEWRVADHRGVFKTSGIGTGITGRGADIGIIDDPVKNAEMADSAPYRKAARNWYDSTFRTRLAPGGGIVMLLTRWSEADLAGYVLHGKESDREQEWRNVEGWRVVNLPALAEEGPPDPLGRQPGEALWPEAYNEESLNMLRESLPARWWLAMYQQRPVNAQGNMLPVTKIEDAQVSLDQLAMLDIYQAWDLAISKTSQSDYSACVTIGVDPRSLDIYILDIWRKRVGFNELLDKIEELAHRWHPVRIGIESHQYQAAAVEEINRRAFLPVEGLKADRDKVTRANILVSRMSGGKIFVDKRLALWGPFEEELLAFPNGSHDDMVDALAYAVLMVAAYPPPASAHLEGEALGFSADHVVDPFSQYTNELISEWREGHVQYQSPFDDNAPEVL